MLLLRSHVEVSFETIAQYKRWMGTYGLCNADYLQYFYTDGNHFLGGGGMFPLLYEVVHIMCFYS